MANAFVVGNKTYETNDKGNRYFVSYDNIYRKRISEASYNAALVAWEAASDQERNARLEASEKSDREAEARVNKKVQKSDKPKAKRSRSKVAFEMETSIGKITLTDKQVDFFDHIPDTCFYENGLESTMWTDVLADEIGGQFAGKPMTVGAMISTLKEKSLIYVAKDRVNGRTAKFFGFTDAGKEVAKKLGLK